MVLSNAALLRTLCRARSVKRGKWNSPQEDTLIFSGTLSITASVPSLIN